MTNTTQHARGRQVPAIGSLSLFLLAMSALMDTAVAAAGAPEALINSEIELVPAGELRRIPFQKMVSSECGRTICEVPIVTIRRNRRIELTHASCTASIEAGGTITLFDVTKFSTSEGSSARSFLLPVFADQTDGRSFYNANNRLSLVAQTGDKIEVVLTASTNVTSLQCKISGAVVTPGPSSDTSDVLFQALAKPDCDVLFCGGGLFRVPRNKRLVITHVACSLAVDSIGTIVRLGVRRKTPGGPNNDFDFQVPRPSGRIGSATIYFSNSDTLIFAENRDLVSVELETSDDIRSFSCNISGELTSL